MMNGVMLNAYPDSIGEKLSDMIKMLKMPAFEDTFAGFYILPTIFNTDLDRGFSVINYDLNRELVYEEDLKDINKLNIMLKFDIVLNHLSVASPQCKDLIEKGEQSEYKDFFIDWNKFWQNNGEKNEEDIIVPREEHLKKLFMRKSKLPVLKVKQFDGSEKPYWNTFYQEIKYKKIHLNDIKKIKGISQKQAEKICKKINNAIEQNKDFNLINFKDLDKCKSLIIKLLQKNRFYLGQLDVNAKSPLVWDFYDETIVKLKKYGCKILRLDAFAYLHKEVGQSNFFNIPGTWDYLERINHIAKQNDLTILPEIHAEYGLGIHDKIDSQGYLFYDFFLPGLILHTIENSTNKAILKWIREIINKGYKTVNMLGCHDGIPLLDLKGKKVDGIYHKGLLEDNEIEKLIKIILNRGGRIKNLYDSTGKKISYYQVNATYFSALGENEKKLLLARAIQMFTPGIPQVWYLDIFAGKNNYKIADREGIANHKEINRTNLSMQDIENGLKKDIVLKQLELIRLRNTSKAFKGNITINKSCENEIDIEWKYQEEKIQLKANLNTYEFIVKNTSEEVNYNT